MYQINGVDTSALRQENFFCKERPSFRDTTVSTASYRLHMSLLKSAATVSVFTLLSRITGLIRDMLIARYFGVSAATDAFYVAFRIPNMLRRLFAEGAFSQAFVPMLSQVKEQQPENERKALPLGALTMTLECGVRFLTDYLDGDHYFGIHRPEHNLDRCRTQFKLVADMEAKWEEMAAIVEEEYSKL